MSTRTDDPVQAVVAKVRGALWLSGLFSSAINILMLTGPLFMLQIYDRVLASRSVPTLVTLFALVAGLYLFMGLFLFIRSRVLSRIGFKLDVELAAIANRRWLFSGLVKDRVTAARPLNDLTTVRQFMGGNGLPALFDLPWIPVYLAIVYLFHVWLGLLATAGALIVIAVTVFNEIVVRKPMAEASGWELKDQNFSESSRQDAEAIIAMGMIGSITRHWEALRHRALGGAQKAGGWSESAAAVTRSTRMLLQSAILALGAYLAIFQEITPGTMIAASILAGRALAPIDAAIGNWRNLVRARQSYGRLKKILGQGVTAPPIVLPAPEGRIEVAGVAKLGSSGTPGSTRRLILKYVTFRLEPGDGLGVIGHSASGKSSLARLLVGLWMPDSGEVRFDGATFDQWDRDEVGKHIGYLPQSVELMAGTVSQNIARFDEDARDEDVVAAAVLADAHELILNLPDGYGTDLGSGDMVLSGGQSQRVALARAVYGVPSLVVLDEPTSHLDMEGDHALARTITHLRKAGSCVVVVAHQPSAIAAVNKILVLKDGRQVEFGPKNEVLAKVMEQSGKGRTVELVE